MTDWNIGFMSGVVGHTLIDGREYETEVESAYLVVRDDETVSSHDSLAEAVRYVEDRLEGGDHLTIDLTF